MLSLQADRLRTEVDQILDIIKSIKERLDGGIPGTDIPARDLDEEVFQVQLRGELILASQRLLALGEILE